MYEFILRVSNHPSSTEGLILDEDKFLEILVKDLDDNEEILNKLEPKILALLEGSRSALSLVGMTKTGEEVFKGEYRYGFRVTFTAR